MEQSVHRPFCKSGFVVRPSRQGYGNRSDFLGGSAATLTRLSYRLSVQGLSECLTINARFRKSNPIECRLNLLDGRALIADNLKLRRLTIRSRCAIVVVIAQEMKRAWLWRITERHVFGPAEPVDDS